MTLAFRVSAIFILFCILLLVASFPVWAKESTSTPTQSGSTGTRKERVKERIETRKENVQEKVASLKERLATKEAALKERLQKFRDKRKAEITEKVSSNLNKINENHTNHMLKFLDKASTILGKLEERVNQGTADIKDPAASKAAIADAKTAIQTAKASVNAQAEKDYTLTITSESRVKKDAQTQRKQLHNDLQTVRKVVVDAKQAVTNAIRVAKSGRMESPSTGSGLKEATRSGQ